MAFGSLSWRPEVIFEDSEELSRAGWAPSSRTLVFGGWGALEEDGHVLVHLGAVLKDHLVVAGLLRRDGREPDRRPLRALRAGRSLRTGRAFGSRLPLCASRALGSRISLGTPKKASIFRLSFSSAHLRCCRRDLRDRCCPRYLAVSRQHPPSGSGSI